MRISITSHAKLEAERRNIPEELIKSTAEEPEQQIPSKKGRIIFIRDITIE